MYPALDSGISAPPPRYNCSKGYVSAALDKYSDLYLVAERQAPSAECRGCSFETSFAAIEN